MRRPKKGYRLKRCPECQRRRHCWFTVTPSAHRLWMCSQGHAWREAIATTALVNELIKSAFLPHLRALFEQESSLLVLADPRKRNRFLGIRAE